MVLLRLRKEILIFFLLILWMILLQWMRILMKIIIIQSVNFGRHLTEILYPFEISYQIFIHILPYHYFFFRNFTLPKFSFEKSYLTKIFFSEMLRNFTIIKVSVNRLYVNVTLRKLRWRQLTPAVNKRSKPLNLRTND